MVVELALDHVAAVAFFDFRDVVGFLVVELAAELVLDDVEHGCVVKFVGRFREILAAVHALHHGSVLAGAGNEIVLGGAGAEPAVALKAERSAVGAGFVLDAALDEKVVSEDLGDSSVFLEQIAALAGFFWEGVEEIECGAIGVHRLEEMKVDVAKMPGW